MQWHELNTDEQIKRFLKLYDNFLDSFVIKFWYDSGNFVCKYDAYKAEQHNKHILTVRFERMEYAPCVAEIKFEGIKRFNYYPYPCMGADLSDILFAKIVKNDKYIYLTTWKDFDPYNEEHLNYNDFMLIEAEKASYRSADKTLLTMAYIYNKIKLKLFCK
ncbi:MAG: hypothetical protein IJR59_00850 [Firmicutes bacterium]|nr:hypothetical protein [Bacillota bacterium]